MISRLDPRSGRSGAHGRLAVPLVASCLLLGCSSAAPVAMEPSPSPLATSPAVDPTPSPPPTSSAEPDGEGVRPAALRLPSIDIDSRVEPVSAVDRVLQIPPEPWVVGWWRDGVGAGSGRGTVVMTAHLDSRKYGTGPFVRAKELEIGAPMWLTDKQGTKHAYAVTAVDTFRKTSLPYAELFTQKGAERVVLVTCGGTYHRDAGGWDSNVVVTFTPAASPG